MTRYTVNIATDAAGDFTGHTLVVSGLVRSIRFVDTDLADTADITITAGASGAAILTLTNQAASATFYPYGSATGTDGSTAITNSFAPIPVANETIKVVVAQGGDTKTGTLHIYIGD